MGESEGRVERLGLTAILRDHAAYMDSYTGFIGNNIAIADVMKEAADEIERLREEVERLRDTIDGAIAMSRRNEPEGRGLDETKSL